MRSTFLAATLAAALAAAPTYQLVRNPLPPRFCDPISQGESGYLKIQDEFGSKSYFYQFWQSRNQPSTDPVALWLTGGPGCSSQLALYTENGPCEVNSDGTVSFNPYAWNQNASVIWLDQPAGAGFSTGDTDTNQAGTSEDIWYFLQAFFSAHADKQSNDFFVFGESYGGHYVPSATYKIFTRNQALQPGEVSINLKGLGIGNGLTEPLVQYQFYAEMAYNYSIEKLGHPVLPLSTYQEMQSELPSCTAQIAACQNDTSQCAGAMEFCNSVLVEPYEQTGLSPYDFRKTCDYPPLCVDMTPVTNYLNDATVQATLGVPAGTNWQPCNFDVNGGFSSDWMKGFSDLVPPMMAAGIQVVIYAGDCGFICNWLGNQAWTLDLQWAGQAGFNAAPMQPWSVAGEPAGQVRSYESLSFVRVFNAGHMAPSDVPQPMQVLFNSFIAGQPLV